MVYGRTRRTSGQPLIAVLHKNGSVSTRNESWWKILYPKNVMDFLVCMVKIGVAFICHYALLMASQNLRPRCCEKDTL
jgi:hypothetical protein